MLHNVIFRNNFKSQIYERTRRLAYYYYKHCSQTKTMISDRKIELIRVFTRKILTAMNDKLTVSTL